MNPPPALRSEEYQHWSRGRGVDVWAMFQAARRGDVARLRELAAANPQLVDCEYAYRHPLRFAVLWNQRAAAEFLLEQGADPTAGFGEETLPQAARERGCHELADWLEHWLRSRYGISPEGAEMAVLIRNREVDAVRKAIELKPELVHAADERGNQPLHWAVMTRQLALIEFLLAHRAAIDHRRPDGARPLELANGDYHYRGWRDVPVQALRPPSVVIGFLLAKGAEYDLTLAARLGDCDRAPELLDAHPELVNVVAPYTTYYSGLPLRCAAAAGHREMVKLLLARGADPNVPEPVAPWGGALRDAIGQGDVEIVRLLLDHGANPNAAVESSGNCLWAARGHEEIYNLVESRGGRITLELACYEGDVELVRSLLAGSPGLTFSEEGLNYAMGEERRELLEFIAREHPQALRGIALGDVRSPELARWLLERGVDAALPDWLGVTPLHRFAKRGDTALGEICLEFGARLDAIDEEYGSTPLGWAARAGQTDMVRWLLAHDAPLTPEGQPDWAHPLVWARKRGHHETAQLLENAG